MSNATDPKPTALLCPLARDRDDQPIDLPDGAVGWRVRRHTGGRPRIVLGVDKQPMQLPLGYSIADVEDILAPGTYRLDIVDQRGEPLGVTIPLSIGQARNGDGIAEPDDEAEPATVALLPPSGSDTRLVLEANVRATQMAFHHNQKTLELGLRMAETLRDGVNVLATAQADWIKSLTTSRGFFRNAAPPPPMMLPPPPPAPADDDDDDEDDEPESPRALDWLEKLGPVITLVAQQVMNAFASRATAPREPAKPKADSGFQVGDAFNWQRAAERGKQAREEKPAAEEGLPPFDVAAAAHFLQIQNALDPDEAALARATAAELSPRDLRAWFDELRRLSVADAAAKIRGLIAAKPAA